MAGTMSINSTACLLVLSFLSNNAYCRVPENVVPMRFERGNLQEYMDDSMDPNFWPVRGRRTEKYDDSANPFSIVNLGGDFSFRRGERRPKEEESTGVFWAGRGRSYDVADPEDGNFWAHRGRSLEPWDEDSFRRNHLIAEEPGWILVVRGESQTGKALKPAEDDKVICSHLGKSKREILRQKLCHFKRKANTLLRELPQTEQFWPVRGKRPTKALPTILEDEQFWPVRGKREEESWQENLRDLKTFWPAREGTPNKHKQPVNGKEVT